MTAFDQAKIDDPRAFERFLRDKGYSRARAKAITARGFGGYSGEQDGISGLVKALEAKRGALPLEEKARERVRMVLAGPWSSWERFRAITVPEGGKIRIRATRAGNYVRGMSAFYELEVRFTAPGGSSQTARWLSNGGAGGNGPYPAAAGLQEVMIRGRAPSLAQRVVVWLDAVR